MARLYKERGSESEAQPHRNYLLGQSYVNKKKGRDGEQFQKLFPTSHKWLYYNSLYWFHHDLILQNDSWRKQLDPVHHWRMCLFYEKAVKAAEIKHGYEGDYEQLKDFSLASDYVLECARDTFKSSIAVSCGVWVMAKHPDWTNLFARATDKGASKRLNQIAKHLLTNRELWKYFPHLHVDPREIKKKKLDFNKDMIQLSYGFDADDGNDDDEITFAIMGKREYTSEANMNAWGLGSSYTGAHISGIAFIDDAVTEDNYKSQIVQDTLYDHLTELSNICSGTAVKLWMGTPYDDNDALQRKKRVFMQVQKEEDALGNNVKVWEHLEIPAVYHDGMTKQECLDVILKGKTKEERELAEKCIVFKSRHTPRDIRKKYYDARTKRFFYSQFLLEIIQDSERMFKEEWLTFYGDNTTIQDPKRSDLRVVGLIDPAGGPGRGEDNQAILVVGIDKNEISWILEDIEGKFTSKALMDAVINIDKAYRGVDEWYMENYGMAEELRGLIQQIMNASGYRISIMPLSGGTTAGAKWDRIESSTWVWEMRRVRINERHENFLRQYKGWKRPPPPGLGDHLLDLFGYFKNMIYANASSYNDISKSDFETPDNISELARNQILAIRKEHEQLHKNDVVYCIQNWHPMTIGDINKFIGIDGQPKCSKCGSDLWLTAEEEHKGDYAFFN